MATVTPGRWASTALYDRRLGRPARWRAGSGPGRAHGRGADPVRRVCPAADARRGVAARPLGVLVTTSAKLPPPLRYFQPGDRSGGRAQASCISCFRRTARGSICGRRTTSRLRCRSRSPAPWLRSPFWSMACRLLRCRAARCSFSRHGPGFARVTVIDGSGAADSVMVRLDDGARRRVRAVIHAGVFTPPCARP